MTRRSRLAALAIAVALLTGCSAQQGGAAFSASAPAVVAVEHPAAATPSAPRADPGVNVLTPKTSSAAGGPAAKATRTGVVAHGAAARPALAAGQPQPACGRPGPAPAHYAHVVWIWLENRSYDTVIGAPGTAARRQAPYLNSLADACGLATNYHNVSHPSQPNYFAAVAGTTGGVTTNCEPTTCSLGNTPTLFSQLSDAGQQWRSYEQSMVGSCRARNRGSYVDRHNPEVYFTSDHQQCLRWDVPLGGAQHGALADALASDSLPAFSFIAPDVCNDMHSCPTSHGDAWLAAWVPRIVASPGYQSGDTALFVTFDEGEGGHTYRCAQNVTDIGCHVSTVVVSPWTPAGTRSDLLFNHYSLLRTAEQLLGLPYLGQAADTRSMVGAFHL
jgi:phospholipase C